MRISTVLALVLLAAAQPALTFTSFNVYGANSGHSHSLQYSLAQATSLRTPKANTENRPLHQRSSDGGLVGVAAQPNPVVLVCTGDACEDVGARDLIKLARQRAPESIKCKSTGCLGMCGQGPAIAVQTVDGGALQIYRDVDDKKLDTIFQELKP